MWRLWRRLDSRRRGGGWTAGAEGDGAEEAGTGSATGAVGMEGIGLDEVDKVAVQIGLGLFYGPFM